MSLLKVSSKNGKIRRRLSVIIEELKERKAKLMSKKVKLESERENLDNEISNIKDLISVIQQEIEQIEFRDEIKSYEPHLKSVMKFLANPLKPTTEEAITLIQHYEDENFVEGLLKHIKDILEDK